MPRPYSIPTRYRRNPYRNTQADRQRIFSIVWEWFVTRKHPRCMNGASCVYRLSHDGNSNGCAVGIFLPSCLTKREDFTLTNTVDQLFEEFPSQVARIFEKGLMGFLTALQNAHDEGSSASLMVANLRDVADDYDLTIPKE